MNFKSSYSTHMKSHAHLLSRVITDNKTFLKKLKRAIRYKKLDAFIIKLFDTYPFTIVQASFVTFFDNCCTAEFDECSLQYAMLSVGIFLFWMKKLPFHLLAYLLKSTMNIKFMIPQKHLVIRFLAI